MYTLNKTNAAPKEGLLIQTSYKKNEKKCEFTIWNLATNKVVGRTQTIYEKGSDNAVGLYAFIFAIKISKKKGFEGNIYLQNNYSFNWICKGAHRSKEVSPEVNNFLNVWLRHIAESGLGNRAQLWNPLWEKPYQK